MQLEIGSIIEGKVSGIKNFGAFVKLEDGTTGMVHISEVSNEYIQELTEVLSEGQIVKVKVISVSPEGKVALSIKQTQEQPQGQNKNCGREAGNNKNNGGQENRANRSGGNSRGFRPADTGKVWQPKQQAAPSGEISFEDMMSKFKTQSEEKISDLRKVTEAHRGGGYSRRR